MGGTVDLTGWGIGLGIAAVAYVAVCLVLRGANRQLMFRPWKFLIDPRLCAVDGVELVDIHPDPAERLYVWHRAPAVEGAPVLIYFDGNRGNISIWNRRWRRIAASGAGFIALSYRGYGGSTKQPSEEGLHEDARLTWDWASQHYPATQLALHGFSLGTGFAAKLGADLKTVPVILEAPYITFVKRAQEFLPFLPMGLIIRDKIETKKWIGDIEAPVMIVHGEKDKIVPPRHGRVLYQLAKDPKRLEIVAGANHLTLPANGLYPLIWSLLDYAPPPAVAAQALRAEQGLSPTDVPMPAAYSALAAEPTDQLVRLPSWARPRRYFKNDD